MFWHIFWHLYLAYLLAYLLTYLSGISIWQIHLAHVSGISFWHYYLAYLLAFYLTYHSAILSGISSGILSGTPIWHSTWHIFWHIYLALYIWHIYLAYLLTFYLAYLSGVDFLAYWGPAGKSLGVAWSWLRSGRELLGGDISRSEVWQGTLGVDGRGWGPSGNTGRGWSYIEVRQGTLGVDGRGWGPAGNTGGDGRGWGPAGNTGRVMVVVEVRQRPLWSRVAVEQEEEERRRRGGGGEEMRGEEEQATDIKSNNPHLAGGEKKTTTALAHNSPSKWRGQTLLRCMKSSFQHRLRRTMQWKIKYLLHLWNFWPGQWSPFIFFAARRWHWQFWDVSQHPYFPVLCLYTHSFSHIPMLHCNKPRWLPSFRPSKYLEGWDLSILSINQSINQPNLI